MPIVSQAQRGLMHGIAEGSIPAGHGGPSKAVAQEFVDSDKPGKLPERKSKAEKLYRKKAVSRG